MKIYLLIIYIFIVSSSYAFNVKNFFKETLETWGPTPSFEEKQYYLKPAPLGINVFSAWSTPGGDGRHVKIIDIETGVAPNHEDLDPLFYLSDLPKGEIHHGSAVRGILNAKRDGQGITGIAYESQVGFMSRHQNFTGDQYFENLAKNIQEASRELERGDVLLLEVQARGPRKKFIPVEFWPSIFKVLKEVTDRGVHCVSVAGNGYHSLDDSIYEKAFDLKNRDSGCIIVGASLKNRVRAPFSNYGSRVDAFAYGEDIVTTGYGDLFNGGKERKYTQRFGGTSSAAPIVAGVVAVVSSIAKEHGIELSPKKLRKMIRETGTPQTKHPKLRYEPIGNLPDLNELIGRLFGLYQI